MSGSEFFPLMFFMPFIVQVYCNVGLSLGSSLDSFGLKKLLETEANLNTQEAL